MRRGWRVFVFFPVALASASCSSSTEATTATGVEPQPDTIGELVGTWTNGPDSIVFTWGTVTQTGMPGVGSFTVTTNQTDGDTFLSIEFSSGTSNVLEEGQFTVTGSTLSITGVTVDAEGDSTPLSATFTRS